MDFFWTGLPWLLSVLTVVTIWLTGNKDIRGFYLGIVAQFFWVAFDIYADALGLLPVSFALFYVYIRNIIKWRREKNDFVEHYVARFTAGGPESAMRWLQGLHPDQSIDMFVRDKV